MKISARHGILGGEFLSIALTPVFFGQSAISQASPDPRNMHLVYKLPGAERAKVREGVKFGSADGRELLVDVYQPPDLTGGEQRAAILFISGGEKVRDWPQYREYGQVAATQGFVALIPDKSFPRGADGIINGTADTQALLKFLVREGSSLGIDPKRIALWIFSGAGQLGAVGFQGPKADGPPPPKCVIIFYAALDFAPDLVKAKPSLTEYSPVYAVEVLAEATPPIFLARAGQDTPMINAAIGNFVSSALKGNAPLTLINYPRGRHAFDALNDTDESRAIIKAAFDFIRTHTKTP